MADDFDPLTPQEARLVRCASAGTEWTPDVPEWTEFDADPAYAYGWNENRTLRAKLIRCLLTGDPWPGREKPWPVHSRGLMVRGASIDGELDLDGVVIAKTLWLFRCAFTGAIVLTDAKCQTLSFRGSHLPFGLNAERAEVKGALLLSETFVLRGAIFVGAKIEGQLDCGGSRFENAGGRALDGDAMTVGASIFLRAGFSAKGEVNLVRAKVGGQLSCIGGRFENASGRALNGDAMTVGADVFLRNGFSAKGEVVLRRAKIEGQLDCGGGRFEDANGRAVDGDAMTVGADVFLRDGFSAKGEVILRGAKIEGQLACTGGRFENAGGRALNGDTLIVGASVFLRGGFSAEGRIDFTRAKIAGNLRFEGGTLSNLSGDAIDLTLAEIGAGLFIRDLRPAEGRPRDLDGRLILEQARCRTFSDDRRSWPDAGKLSLDGFVYERFHDCETKSAVRNDWLRLQPDRHLKTSFRPQPWTQAIKVLRDMGHDDDARDLAIAREIARSESAEIGRARKVWLWLQRYTTGFGYRPQYALAWSLGIFLASWLVFAAAANLGFMAPRDGSVVAYLAAHPGAKLPEHYTRFNAPIYAFDNYLPIIELGQDQAWEPSDVQFGHRRLTSEGWWTQSVRRLLGHDWSLSGARSAAPMPAPDRFAVASAEVAADLFRLGVHRFVYWFAEILGWLFVSLYIAGMSGIMKDE